MPSPLPPAKKSFGQNFLHDPAVLQRVAEHCGGAPGQVLVELGAGTGLLTERLAASGARVIAVERDRDLVPGLRERFETAHIPKPLQGTGIGLVTAGLLALSFFAFKGMI